MPGESNANSEERSRDRRSRSESRFFAPLHSPLYHDHLPLFESKKFNKNAMSTKDSSTRLAKAKGKRANADQDVAHDDLGDNTNSEHVEFDQEEQQPPPRKRQRVTTSSTKGVVRKKQVRGKQGLLAGLVNMPIDIFTEIVSHLLPGDIISLARSNKFFRNLLMHRSAIHIWHGTMRNVEGLPPCPPELSEPHYLSLLFSKTCSMCGGAARGRMDPMLLVRLCGPCRDTNLVSLYTLPMALIPLVPCSAVTAPSAKRRSAGAFVLSEESTRILAEYEEKKLSNDNCKLDAWIEEKREIVDERRKQARVLAPFLTSRELDREQELEDAKAARMLEIKRRLTNMGWTDEDMEFGWWSSNQRPWNDLVSQPKPLTDRIWANIQPKLIPLLQTNREERLHVERVARKVSRRARLSELIHGIKDQNSAKLQFEVRRPVPLPSGPKPTTTVTLQTPFPDFTYTLEWPVVKNLHETDSTVAEMEASFEERREEIEALVAEWQNRIQSHLANLARSGPEARGDTLRLNNIVGINDSDPFADMSGDFKLLLRADSLFYTTTSLSSMKRPRAYDTIIHTDGLIGRYDSTPMGATVPATPPKLDHIHLYTEAQEAARSLLVPEAPRGRHGSCLQVGGIDPSSGRAWSYRTKVRRTLCSQAGVHLWIFKIWWLWAQSAIPVIVVAAVIAGYSVRIMDTDPKARAADGKG
ncbi:hypothetical protein RSAG8_05687, partial [Rhizoctonia solani AG-8 WAC10335]